MVDSLLRPVKERLFIPLCRRLAKHVHPNVVTVSGFVLGLVSCGFILGGKLAIALGFGILSRILDGMDGTVARLAGKQSDFGGYLDIMLDFILYTLAPISFATLLAPIYPSQPIFLSLTILLGSFYINVGSWAILSAILEKRRNEQVTSSRLTTIEMPGGIIEGTETLIFFGLFYLLPRYVYLLFFIMAGLTILGAVQRFIWAARNLRSS